MSRQQSPMPPSVGMLELFAAAIRHFFPRFWEWFDDLEDPRKVPGRCQYTQRILVATVLFRCLAGLRSHRQMDGMFNGEGSAILENLRRITGDRTAHVPRGQTINYWLENLLPDGLKAILDRMATLLLRSKRLEECREPLSQSMMLASDGTGLMCTIRKIGHSTVRHHRDGRCTSHIYVLVVAFVSPGGLVIPFHVEFVENGKDYRPEFDKQDCEHKAQLKLFDIIRGLHPRLPVTVLMDALSLDYTQMANCIEKQWDFVISYKDGAVKGLAEAIAAALETGKGVERLSCSRTEKDGTVVTKDYTWFQVTYKFGKALEKGNGGFPVVYAKMRMTATTADGKVAQKTYERITSHSLSSKNIGDFFDYMGGTRWCEENQGFNEMKNLGLNIGHAYGSRGEAAVNHFLLQMIAFIIMQLAGKTDLYGKMEELHAKAKCRADAGADGGKADLYGKMEELHAKAKCRADAGADGGKAERPATGAARVLRRAYSSLFLIAEKFLKDVTGRIMGKLDEKAVAGMRIRWAYG